MSAVPDIRLENLTVGYNGEAVVSDIDAVLPGGEISVILGGSGSGKSTLLKHILRLEEPITGRVLFGPHDICCLGKRAMHCIKQRIGVLFQDGAMLGSLSLADNVALPLKEHTKLSKQRIREIVTDKLALVGLDRFLDYYPHQLSGGMRKRAGLARAMVMDPAILFCDEPTSGLDPVTAAELDQLLLEMHHRFGMGMAVVSHDLANMRTLADFVMVLGGGRVMFQGSQKELEAQQDPYLRRFLDRRAEEREEPRVRETAVDPSVMKVDCSEYWSIGEAKDQA
jgi:phospholipid/cholesterol/gamma-HCH transport system ATP-binding protein